MPPVMATWPWSDLRQVDVGLVCELKEVVGDIGSGLVGLHLKGMGTGKLFPVSRNQLALGGSLSSISQAPKIAKHQKT